MHHKGNLKMLVKKLCVQTIFFLSENWYFHWKFTLLLDHHPILGQSKTTQHEQSSVFFFGAFFMIAENVAWEIVFDMLMGPFFYRYLWPCSPMSYPTPPRSRKDWQHLQSGSLEVSSSSSSPSSSTCSSSSTWGGWPRRRAPDQVRRRKAELISTQFFFSRISHSLQSLSLFMLFLFLPENDLHNMCHTSKVHAGNIDKILTQFTLANFANFYHFLHSCCLCLYRNRFK